MPPRARAVAVPWDDASPAPLVLLLGGEDLLAERAQARILAALRAGTEELEVNEISGAGYTAGLLSQAASPSLFAVDRCVIVSQAQDGGDALAKDVAAWSEAPAADVTLIVAHAGGVKAKKIADQLKAAGAEVVNCEALKKDADRESFAAKEFIRAGRQIASPALRAVLDAAGSDLRELAAGCAQLMADCEGPITKEMVDEYYQGRQEVTGFKVADAAIAGNGPGAVVLLRHALATGAEPVPINAAIAAKLRTLAKVAGARRRGLDPVADMGLSSWQVDRARRELRGWDGARLAAAIQAVAQADAEIKGASRAPAFALERAVLAVARAARGDR